MTFYLITPGQSGDTVTDHNILGEVSMKSFHTGYAWNVLNRLIKNDKKTILESIIIKDSSNKSWTIEKFLTEISKYNLVTY